MTTKWEGKDSKETIINVQYSPNSQMFAVANMDNQIYIYDNKGYCCESCHHPKLKVLTDLHKATILSMDFSNDSYFIQTSSIDYEHIRCKKTLVICVFF